MGHRWLADHARILKERKLKVGQGIRLVELAVRVGDLWFFFLVFFWFC